MKERIYYLDIAKALVIVGTILLHIGAFHSIFCGGEGFWVFSYITIIVGLLHCPYSMPAFFIMRGYYNKERSLANEIKGNCKRLIVPMFLLYYLPNPQWFCYAMFFSLLFYNLIHRLSNKWLQLAIMLTLAVLGVFMQDLGISWRFVYLGFILLPFFWVGERCRWITTSNKFAIFSLFCYIAFVFAITAKSDFSYSTLRKAILHIIINDLSTPTLKGLLLSYPWAICGTSVIFWVARLIKRNRILEYIGRNSMVFYLFHFNILWVLLQPTAIYISSLRGPLTGLYSLCLYALFFVIITGVCALVSKFVNKYCPWVEGKGL